MKKIGILLVLLSAISLASYEEVNANFNRIEADYEKLISLEDQQYNKLKENASNASQQLEEKQAMKAKLEEKIEKLETAKDTNYYKTEYSELVKQYKNVVKALDVEITNLNKVVDDFSQIEAIKGGM